MDGTNSVHQRLKELVSQRRSTRVISLTLRLDSRYIKEENLSTIAKFFPEFELEVLDTGHWGTPFVSIVRVLNLPT